jgi:hypothetical protein
MKYRKNPVIIEAKQLTKEAALAYFVDKIPFWAGYPLPISGSYNLKKMEVHSAIIIIKTLEGEMVASLDDWIIKGVKGEFYPCKPDIFEMTYSPEPQTESKGAMNIVSQIENAVNAFIKAGPGINFKDGRYVFSESFLNYPWARQLQQDACQAGREAERMKVKDELKILTVRNTHLAIELSKTREAALREAAKFIKQLEHDWRESNSIYKADACAYLEQKVLELITKTP